MIDQRILPRKFKMICCRSLDEMIEAIGSMAIRGAPALAVAGAYGMVLAALNHKDDLRRNLDIASSRLIASRPTAVNLAWGVNRMLQIVNDVQIPESDLYEKLLAEAQRMAEEDVAITANFLRMEPA